MAALFYYLACVIGTYSVKSSKPKLLPQRTAWIYLECYRKISNPLSFVMMNLGPQTLKEIYLSSAAFPLNAEIISGLNTATLTECDLKFIGTLFKVVNPKYIFEFGGGISTLFMSEFLEENSHSRIFSVDHSANFMAKTQKLCNNSENITFLLCPISTYFFRGKAFPSYSNAYIKILNESIKFDFVLIDGPSGRRFGREATLYQIAPYLTSGTLIFLHDINRISEQKTILNWKRVWPGSLVVLFTTTKNSGFIVFRLKHPPLMKTFPFTPQSIVMSWLKTGKKLLYEYVRKMK